MHCRLRQIWWSSNRSPLFSSEPAVLHQSCLFQKQEKCKHLPLIHILIAQWSEKQKHTIKVLCSLGFLPVRFIQNDDFVTPFGESNFLLGKHLDLVSDNVDTSETTTTRTLSLGEVHAKVSFMKENKSKRNENHIFHYFIITSPAKCVLDFGTQRKTIGCPQKNRICLFVF